MEDQNKHIKRLLEYVCTFQESDVNLRGLLLFVLKRLVKISIVSGLLLLLKLRKQKLTVNVLKDVLNKFGAFGVLSLAYPLLTMRTEKKGINLPALETTVIAALANYRQSIPTWIITYLGTESLSDYVKNLKFAQIFIELDDQVILGLKQLALSLIIPYLSDNQPKDSALYKILFNKRSYLKDFLLFNSIWNFLSIYQKCKNIFGDYQLKKQSRKTKAEIRYNNENLHKRSKSSFSLNWKPMLDKLIENQDINDLVDKETIINRLLNSFLFKNILPTLKWSIWRQLIFKIFASKDKKHKISNIHSSVLIFFAFTILNGSHSEKQLDMNIRIGVIKYMFRSIVTNQLQNFNFMNKPTCNKLITFLTSQLAIYNFK